MTAHTFTFGVQPVEVRIVDDPISRRAILLQLPQGWITIHRPDDARQLASSLYEAAAELEQGEGQ